MANPREPAPPQPIIRRLPFPIKGTDQGWALGDQPPLTTPNLLNVRALDWRNRQGGGKRYGHSKAFTTIAGESASRRINGLAVYSRALPAPGSSIGTFQALDDSFTGPTVAAPADLNTDWHTFQHGSAINGAEVNYDCDVETLVAKRLVINPTSGAGAVLGAAIAYATTNDLTVTLGGNGTFSTTNSNNGNTGEVAGAGPFLRGSPKLDTFIGCRLRRNGAASAIIDIVSVSAGVVTTLASSAAITTNAPGTTSYDLSIRLIDTGAQVIATVNWPTQDSAASWTNIIVTATTSTYAGQTRAGVALMGVASFSSFASGYRAVARVQAVKIVPPTPTVNHQILGTTTTSPLPLRYFIPDGWTATVVSTAGAQTTTVGFDQTATLTPSDIARVDTTNQVLTQVDTNPTDKTGFLTRTSTGEAISYGIEIKHRGTLPDGDVARLTFITRVSTDFKSCIRIRPNPTSGSANLRASKMMKISDFTVTKVVNGVLTNLNVSNAYIPFRTDDWVRCVDDGNTITISINGMTMHTYAAGTVTEVAGNTRVGCMPDHNGVANYGAFGFRLIEVNAATATDVGETDAKVAVFTTGYVDVGDLSAMSLTRVSGVGLYNPITQATSFAQKFYAVDGVASKIIDPTLLTVSDYTATNGTAPVSCRLIALYRGRIVQARDSNPSIWYMSRVGYPRDYDYLNANGNGGTSTAANYGTNADVGVPGDAITALIPFSDDYLYFGCANTIWMLEGDPSYGGSIQNVTYRSGVVGPRAFAFDDAANLYFVGAAGVYRMARGSKDPVNITGRKLINLLDSIDLSSTFVQLAWDASGGYLNIYLTPTDGTTVGVHCIYDPASAEGGAWWLDRYPVSFGPWAVAEIVGVQDKDRRVIIGCNDGYVRRPEDGKLTDDGTAIDSWVEIGPFELGGGSVYSMVTEIQAMMGAGGGIVTWYWFTGDSPEEVASQTFGQEVASGTWGGGTLGNGFQTPTGLKQTGGAHKIRIRQNTSSETDTWSLERVQATFKAMGRRRL